MSRVVLPTDAMRAAAPQLVEALVAVRIAETQAERDAIFAFRYGVYGQEFGLRVRGHDDARGHVHDSEDDERYTTLLYTTDDDQQVTGTARIRQWGPGEIPESDWHAFSMERFGGIERLRTAELGRLMAARSQRGQMDVVSMGCATYQLLADEFETDIAFASCHPGLLKHYRLLGWRTYAGRMLPIAGGVAVPLVIFPSDHAYFGMVGAFVGAFVESFFGDGRRPPLDLTPWADILGAERAPVQFDADVVLDRITGLRGAANGRSILNSLSEQTIATLSTHGFLMDLAAGQLLTEQGIKQQDLFVVIEGALEVHDGDRRLRTIGPGEVIGEIGFFGTSGRRSASVTAVTDGQVLALPRSFIDVLRRDNPACAAEILFELARTLADRQYL